MPKERPPYRVAFCPAHESERAAGLPADVRGKFSSAELAELETMAPKRLKDRIGGRLAAKAALAAHFSEDEGWEPEARELEIANDEGGRPVLRLPEGAPASPPSFSIAHCPTGAACAVGAPGRLVGVDLEPIVARPPEVIAFVARADEARAAAPSDPEAQARLWTGKEAALKLLGLGLDADAKDVRLKEGEVELAGRPADAWRARGKPRIRVSYSRTGGSMLAVAYTGD